MVPYGRHGWNSLPIMSLQGQQRRREHEMHSLHVLLAYTHAYSASLLCSSVIDRCGRGSSHLSSAWRGNNPSSSVTLILIYLLFSESPQLWCPSCPIYMHVIAYEIILSPECCKLFFFFGATDDTWGFKGIVLIMLMIWILILKG